MLLEQDALLQHDDVVFGIKLSLTSKSHVSLLIQIRLIYITSKN